MEDISTVEGLLFALEFDALAKEDQEQILNRLRQWKTDNLETG